MFHFNWWAGDFFQTYSCNYRCRSGSGTPANGSASFGSPNPIKLQRIGLRRAKTRNYDVPQMSVRLVVSGGQSRECFFGVNMVHANYCDVAQNSWIVEGGSTDFEVFCSAAECIHGHREGRGTGCANAQLSAFMSTYCGCGGDGDGVKKRKEQAGRSEGGVGDLEWACGRP